MIYPWQQKQWQQVSLQWHNNKLPQALLLAGPQGMGKRAFAEALASYLLCGYRQQTACGKCRSCLLIAAGTHPDLLPLIPLAESKSIKIEQTRELLAELAQTAQQSPYQVVIIDPAEAMNTAAANALLKNLEEPPGQVIFLLISHQPSIIPATILSRCQRLNFAPPDAALCSLWLQQQLPDQEVTTLLKLAENIPLRALAFAQNGWAAVHDKMQYQLLQLSQGVGDPLALATDCLQEEFAQVYWVMWSLLTNLIRLKLVPDEQQTELTAISTKVTCPDLFYLLDKLAAVKALVQNKINLNMQLVYEQLLIAWAQLFLGYGSIETAHRARGCS